MTEKELIEAAKISGDNWKFIDESDNKFYQESFIEGAKSEASRKYWEGKNVGDAVEFAHWLLCNYNTSEEGMGLCWLDVANKTKHNTEQLYELFKIETTKK